MIDGAVARASNRVTHFGALFDSTIDRYSEIVVFIGVAIYFTSKMAHDANLWLLTNMAVFGAMAGSIMVSYVRARAEGLGFECKNGLMQRPERIVIIGICSFISTNALIFSVIVVAIFSNFTALQRLYHIWSLENSAKWKKVDHTIDHE